MLSPSLPRALSDGQAGDADERLQARVLSGKDNQVVFDAHCTAAVIQPYVTISTKSISYLYSYEKGVPLVIQSSPMHIVNATNLPMGVSLKCNPPWSVDMPEWVLQPEERADITVYFNPGYKPDRQSSAVKNRLTIAYHDTPFTDKVDLLGGCRRRAARAALFSRPGALSDSRHACDDLRAFICVFVVDYTCFEF